jgi:hypothetical protein
MVTPPFSSDRSRWRIAAPSVPPQARRRALDMPMVILSLADHQGCWAVLTIVAFDDVHFVAKGRDVSNDRSCAGAIVMVLVNLSGNATGSNLTFEAPSVADDNEPFVQNVRII